MKKTSETLRDNSAKFIRSRERLFEKKYTSSANLPLPSLGTKQTEKVQKRVLIVDDSIVIREMASLTLKQAEYQVEKAWDGKHAWELLKGGALYNLIFCDVKMPRMNGLELLCHLKEDPILAKIPVAMLTCCDNKEIKKIATELGACAYQNKPYQVKDLLDTAELLIKGKNLLSELNSSLANRKTLQIPQALWRSIQAI